MSTRPIVQVVAAVSLVVVALALVARGAPAAAVNAAARLAPPRAAVPPAQGGTLREFTLTASEVDWEIMPGTRVRAWAYNGTVPGPQLRVTEGDLVRVTLRNNLPVPTTLHWHGVDVPNNMDGVPGITQNAVEPGGSFVYEFVATNPGTRWYHPHQDAEIQTPLGLYGALIIDPAVPPDGALEYDREFTYILAEWSLALTPTVAVGNASLPLSGRGAPHSKQLDFDLFLMNGKVHDAIPPIMLREGERVRVRLINAGALVHTMHPHGHSVKVIATDGNFLAPSAQYLKDSITIGPSERFDFELVAHNPGVWMFHCHMQHHAANGMMTTMQYEGVAPPVGSGSHQHGAPAAPPPVAAAPPTPTVAPAGAPSAPATPTAAPAAAPASGNVTVVMADNRFQPPTQAVAIGTTVVWPNRGTNIHTVSAFDGSFESGSVLPGGNFAFTFTRPGQYRYLCRQHLLNGMTGTITVS